LDPILKGGATVFPTLNSNYCKTNKNCTVEGEEEFIDIKKGLSMPNVHTETNTGKTWEDKMNHQCANRSLQWSCSRFSGYT
jgi:hypothetical protein